MKLTQAKIRLIHKLLVVHERRLTNRSKAPMADEVILTRKMIKEFEEIRR